MYNVFLSYLWGKKQNKKEQTNKLQSGSQHICKNIYSNIYNIYTVWLISNIMPYVSNVKLVRFSISKFRNNVNWLQKTLFETFKQLKMI